MHDQDGSDESMADPAGAAMEQFQNAALDAVRAARAMLDAAESVIKDPAALDAVVRTVSGLARSAGETVVGFAAGTTAHPQAAAGTTEQDGSVQPDDGFQRIRVD